MLFYISNFDFDLTDVFKLLDRTENYPQEYIKSVPADEVATYKTRGVERPLCILILLWLTLRKIY